MCVSAEREKRFGERDMENLLHRRKRFVNYSTTLSIIFYVEKSFRAAMIIISCTIISRDDVEVDFHGTSLEHEGQRGQHACSTRCLTIRKMLGKKGGGGRGRGNRLVQGDRLWRSYAYIFISLSIFGES